MLTPSSIGAINCRREYSRLQHLVSALRLNHDPEKTVVTALSAYFDASGHPDQGTVLAVGGFLSFEPRWKELETRWAEVLKDAGIKIFHMNHLITNKGEYVSWKGQDKKKAKFLGRLAAIIADCVQQSFASCVILDDWRRANQEYELEESDFQPYSLAGWSCVNQVTAWCEYRLYNKAGLLVVCEHGDKHQFNMIRRVEEDDDLIVHAERKKDLAVLQTADFGAWQILNVQRALLISRGFTGLPVEPWLWEVYARLFTRVNIHSLFSLDADAPWVRKQDQRSTLLHFCQDFPISKRQTSTFPSEDHP